MKYNLSPICLFFFNNFNIYFSTTWEEISVFIMEAAKNHDALGLKKVLAMIKTNDNNPNHLNLCVNYILSCVLHDDVHDDRSIIDMLNTHHKNLLDELLNVECIYDVKALFATDAWICPLNVSITKVVSLMTKILN